MRKITREEFNEFVRNAKDRIECPSGDYSKIKRFPAKCSFDKECSFDEWSFFGEECHFKEKCSFKRRCFFGIWCSFGKGCIFGVGCIFGGGCHFNERCSFFERCHFGGGCHFDEECFFGKGCSFGVWCRFSIGCKAESPFWDYIYEPPFETEGKILPTQDARQYWEERLNMGLGNCYEEIEEQIQPLLPKILERTDLTRCERRILESWRKR